MTEAKRGPRISLPPVPRLRDAPVHVAPRIANVAHIPGAVLGAEQSALLRPLEPEGALNTAAGMQAATPCNVHRVFGGVRNAVHRAEIRGATSGGALLALGPRRRVVHGGQERAPRIRAHLMLGVHHALFLVVLSHADTATRVMSFSSHTSYVPIAYEAFVSRP